MSAAHKLTPFLTRVPAKKPVITVAQPYPLLDPGEYIATCTEADFEWARAFGAWKVRLVLEPQNYAGRPYTGKLCKFLDLGRILKHPTRDRAAHFRMLWVEVNGDQPTRADVDVSVFVGRLYQITVETVATNRKSEPLPPEHWYSIVRKIRSLAPSNPSTLITRGTLEPFNRPTEQPRKPTPRQRDAVVQEREERKDEFG